VRQKGADQRTFSKIHSLFTFGKVKKTIKGIRGLGRINSGCRIGTIVKFLSNPQPPIGAFVSCTNSALEKFERLKFRIIYDFEGPLGGFQNTSAFPLASNSLCSPLNPNNPNFLTHIPTAAHPTPAANNSNPH